MLLTTDPGAKTPKLDAVTRELSERTVALAEARSKLQELEAEVFRLRCKGGEGTNDNRLVDILNALSPTALSPSLPTRGTALEEIYDRVDWVYLSSKLSPLCSPFPSARLRSAAASDGSADEAAGHKVPEAANLQAVAELQELRCELAKRLLANIEATCETGANCQHPNSVQTATLSVGEESRAACSTEAFELHDAVDRARGSEEAICSAQVAATAAMATVNALLVANAAATRVQSNSVGAEPIESAMEGMHACLSELQAGAEGLTHAVSASLAQLRSRLDNVMSPSADSVRTLPPPREVYSPYNRLRRNLGDEVQIHSSLGSLEDMQTSRCQGDNHSRAAHSAVSGDDQAMPRAGSPIRTASAVSRDDQAVPRAGSPIRMESAVSRDDQAVPRAGSPVRIARVIEADQGHGRRVAVAPIVRVAAVIPPQSPMPISGDRVRSVSSSSPVRRATSPVRLTPHHGSFRTYSTGCGSEHRGSASSTLPTARSAVSLSSASLMSPLMPLSPSTRVTHGLLVAGPNRSVPARLGKSLEVHAARTGQSLEVAARMGHSVEAARASSPVRASFPSETRVSSPVRAGFPSEASKVIVSHTSPSVASLASLAVRPTGDRAPEATQFGDSQCCDSLLDISSQAETEVIEDVRCSPSVTQQGQASSFVHSGRGNGKLGDNDRRPGSNWMRQDSYSSPQVNKFSNVVLPPPRPVQRTKSQSPSARHRTFQAIQPACEASTLSPSMSILREDGHPGAPPPTARSPFETPPTSIRCWHS